MIFGTHTMSIVFLITRDFACRMMVIWSSMMVMTMQSGIATAAPPWSEGLPKQSSHEYSCGVSSSEEMATLVHALLTLCFFLNFDQAAVSCA